MPARTASPSRKPLIRVAFFHDISETAARSSAMAPRRIDRLRQPARLAQGLLGTGMEDRSIAASPDRTGRERDARGQRRVRRTAAHESHDTGEAMSDEKKRGRSASMEAGKNKPAPAKRQRAARGEPQPEPELPPPEIRPPDTAGFFKRITTIAKASSARASGHQGYRLTVGIEEGAQKLKQPWSADAADNRVKPGHLSSAD
jgi:hypothetical protein